MKNPETRKKVSKTMSELYRNNPERNPSYGKTTYQLTDPFGNIYIVSGGFCKWCEERELNHNRGWTAKIMQSSK